MSSTSDKELEIYLNAFIYDFVGKSIVDVQGSWIKMNPSFCKMLGYSEQELRETNFYDLFFTDPTTHLLNEVFENDNEYLELELHFLTKQGKKLWLLMNITLIRVSQNPHYFILQILDITSRKEYEQRIDRMNAEMNLILDSVSEGIYGLDGKGCVIFWNSAAARMTGYRQEEVTSGNLHELIHHTDKHGTPVPIHECPGFQAVAQGKPAFMPYELFWRKDGTNFPVECTLNPIYQHGAYVGSVVTFKDITERIKSNELMLRSEKLSIAGQLAAGIAHEIRNPLTSLKGFTRLIQQSDLKKEYYLSIMEGELHRIEQIVGELLLLAKPQNARFHKHNLVDTIKQIIALLQTQAIMNNIEIEFHHQTDEAEIYCDENQIKQVVINLLKNALEVSPPDGRVVIEIDTDAKGVSISIRDEGPGIPEDTLRKLGEPFFTTKEKGTGLGLTVSYNIIEAHGGRIEVHSIVNQGTTFTILLPYAPKELTENRLLTG